MACLRVCNFEGATHGSTSQTKLAVADWLLQDIESLTENAQALMRASHKVQSYLQKVIEYQKILQSQLPTSAWPQEYPVLEQEIPRELYDYPKTQPGGVAKLADHAYSSWRNLLWTACLELYIARFNTALECALLTS